MYVRHPCDFRPTGQKYLFCPPAVACLSERWIERPGFSAMLGPDDPKSGLNTKTGSLSSNPVTEYHLFPSRQPGYPFHLDPKLSAPRSPGVRLYLSEYMLV